MTLFGMTAGLSPEFPSPPCGPVVEEVTTEEAGIRPPDGAPVAVTALVREGEVVARGTALACLRHTPNICIAAPIAGQVARIVLLPGRKLSEIVLFREPGEAGLRHETGASGTPAGLRRLIQQAGAWPLIRRRPFGGMPDASETPSAIVVMAADTRPFAPDPLSAIAGQEEAFNRGLSALAHLTDGPVHVVCRPGAPLAIEPGAGADRIRRVDCGPRHPQGAAGIRIHALCPAALDAPVWDIHAEDVAAIGALLDTGELPMRRLVSLAGAALREGRLVATHPGADMRELTRRIVERGGHRLLSGSPLDGQPAQWLGLRDRQVTALPRPPAPERPHWLIAALTRSATRRPVIPTAALTQAFGAAVPALPFIRALGAGDDEAAMRLGVLSFLEEDLALADYALNEGGHLKAELRAMLDRIRTELAA